MTHSVKRTWLTMMVALLLVAVAAGCRRAATDDPAHRLVSGWNRYCMGDFDFAVRNFNEALVRVPTNCLLRQRLLHGLATTLDLRRPGEDPVRAEQLYREAITIAPTNDLSAWCWLALARMKNLPVSGELADLDQQVRAYQEVVDRFPFHPAGEEAFLSQQAARIEKPDEARTREVLTALETFIRMHPQSPWLSTAYSLVGGCCAILGLPEKRLEAALLELKTEEMDPLNTEPDMSGIYWKIATLAEFETGDFALAREYYRKVMVDFPTDQRVFLAKQEIAHMDDMESRIRQEGGER